MATLLTIVIAGATTCAVVGFVGSFAAHILLQFYIDHERVREETGHSGWKIFGSVLAPLKFYKEEARIVWKIQRIGLRSFAIAIGCIVVAMLVAAVFGFPIPVP